MLILFVHDPFRDYCEDGKQKSMMYNVITLLVADSKEIYQYYSFKNVL